MLTGDSAVPTQPPRLQPVTFLNTELYQTLLPGEYLATQQLHTSPRQTRPTMQGTTMPLAYGGIGQDPGRVSGESSDGVALARNSLDAEHMTDIKPTIAALENASHSVAVTGAASTPSLRYPNPWNLQRDVSPNHIVGAARNSRPSTRNVAEHLWLSPASQPPQQPYVLGENLVLFKAATSPSINTRTIHHLLPQYTPSSSNSALMPSTTAFSSYPPLDNISEMHDPRAPYMVEQERAYNQMSDPNAYDHHHDPHQDQPRYPTPPPPLSENPYNAQQATGETPDSRMEMPMEQKSESDAPSPGRSKPVPKPDREVTKDANGRFYCSWAGCTEETKDFGRKCEWRYVFKSHFF